MEQDSCGTWPCRSLEEKGTTVKIRFEEKWQEAQYSLAARVGKIRMHLYKSLKYLSDGISSIQEDSQHAINDLSDAEIDSLVQDCSSNTSLGSWSRDLDMGTSMHNYFHNDDLPCVRNTIHCAKEKLERAFAGLQDCLHHVQEAFSGNLHAVRGTMKEKLNSSFRSLHESLHHTQRLIGFQKTINKFNSTAQCTVEPKVFSSKVSTSSLITFAVLNWILCSLAYGQVQHTETEGIVSAN